MRISLTKITQFSGHKEAIYALVYYNAQKKVLSAGGDGYIVGWDVHGNGDGDVLAEIKTTIYAMSLDEDKNILYAVTRSGELYCIDLIKSTVIKRLIISTKPLFSICLKGQFLFLGDEDGNVFKLDKGGQLICKANFGKKSIRQITPSQGNLFLATSSNNIYEITLDLKIKDSMLQAHDSSIFTCVQSDKKLWTGGRDSILKVWQANELVSEIKAHTLHINSLDYNPQYSLILSGSMDKSVKIWDSNTNKLLKVINKEKCDFSYFFCK